jgi:hypothetical protein
MKRTILEVLGVAVVIVLLAGAAYMLGQLLGEEGTDGAAEMGPRMVLASGSGPDARSVTVHLERAEEVPDRMSDVRGAFRRRQDNRIFITEAAGELMIAMSQDGTLATNADGRELEVVVTGETSVYCDVTAQSYEEPLDEGDTVEQKLKPGAIEEIGEFSAVLVWGEQTGDRVVADVLVYTLPPVLER